MKSLNRFTLDILIEESYRGRGYSKFMMTWLENKSNEMGLTEIGLHVLGKLFMLDKVKISKLRSYQEY
ncbi:MAG: hypothetical protein JNL11_02540 [Bdellovibrionaceae bacterium]|nr:hypothetical protein [Pseudobdellovibrionaceae bacterium]